MLERIIYFLSSIRTSNKKALDSTENSFKALREEIKFELSMNDSRTILYNKLNKKLKTEFNFLLQKEMSKKADEMHIIILENERKIESLLEKSVTLRLKLHWVYIKHDFGELLLELPLIFLQWLDDMLKNLYKIFKWIIANKWRRFFFFLFVVFFIIFIFIFVKLILSHKIIITFK